jgi:hypothetical protein
MTSRGNWNGETDSLLKRIDIPDLSDQLDGVRDYLQELASSFRSIANRRWRNARAPSTPWKGRRSRLANWVLDPSWHRLNDCRRSPGCVADVLSHG